MIRVCFVEAYKYIQHLSRIKTLLNLITEDGGYLNRSLVVGDQPVMHPAPAPPPSARLVGFTGKLLQIFKKWTVSVLHELFQSNFLEKQRRVQK